jgi:hypothetical protein
MPARLEWGHPVTLVTHVKLVHAGDSATGVGVAWVVRLLGTPRLSERSYPVPPEVIAALEADGEPAIGNECVIEADRLNRAVRSAGFSA